jgi:membrane protein involved in colicin uptake
MKYRVAHHLKRDGKEYGPGDAITLTEAEAKQCGSALQPWSADEAAKAEAKRKTEDSVQTSAEAQKRAEDDEAKKVGA